MKQAGPFRVTVQSLLQMIADTIAVFVGNAGEGMLYDRLPGDFAEDFIHFSG